MAGLLYLPNQDWTVATKADINAAAASTGSAADRQITVAADGQRLRITYGRDRLGADLANVVVSSAYVYAVCVWGVGPIAAVESITMGDKPLTGYTADHYLGAPGQLVHAGLRAAFAANGIDYADSLPGVAYSVVWGPAGQDDFDPMSISAVVRGRTVFDPRTGATAWSDSVIGMREYALHPADPFRRWITEQGMPFGTLFPDPMGAYTDPLGSYKAGPSEWVSEVYDFGAVLGGNWAATLDVTTLAGATTVQLELSLDAVTWVQHPLSVKAQGRFVRLRASNATGAMVIALPGAGVRIDAVPMTERGTAMSSALGPTEITLERAYVKAYGLPQITVGGTTPGSAVVDDDIDVGTPTKFRVYIFDADWNLVARPFGWVFNGV